MHLVRECRLGGPVHYRWMYPIERYYYNKIMRFFFYTMFIFFQMDYGITIEFFFFLYCRSLGRFKFTVRNKAAPEGSIAEGYIANELLTFCSRYLLDTPTIHIMP
jgi:hypothetical protein